MAWSHFAAVGQGGTIITSPDGSMDIALSGTQNPICGITKSDADMSPWAVR